MIGISKQLFSAQARTHFYRFIFALLGLAPIAGCAVADRRSINAESLQAHADAARLAQEATITSLIDSLAHRCIVRGDRTLDLLLLSGGGQHGAYGIGFLRGWQTRTDAPMPRFDLVTGVSTGAL